MSAAPEQQRAGAGLRISMAIAAYLTAKPVFNFLVLGGSIRPLALGLAAAVCFRFGIRRSNLVIAVLLMLAACVNMPASLRRIGLNMYLVYALEGLADMLCAAVLARCSAGAFSFVKLGRSDRMSDA